MVSIFSLCILYFYNKTKKVFHNNSEIHTLFTHIHTLLFSFKARNKMKIENQTIASFFMYKSNTFAFIFCCHPSSNKIEKKYEKKKHSAVSHFQTVSSPQTRPRAKEGGGGARGQFLFSFCCYQNGNSETRASECQRKEVRGFLSYTP